MAAQNILRCVVHRGEHLVSGDQKGKGDHCVLLTYEDCPAEYQTKVIRKSLDPVWEESFDLVMPNPNAPVIVQLYDKDPNQYDFLGAGVISTSLLQKDTPTDLCINIVGHEKQPQQVYVTVTANFEGREGNAQSKISELSADVEKLKAQVQQLTEEKKGEQVVPRQGVAMAYREIPKEFSQNKQLRYSPVKSEMSPDDVPAQMWEVLNDRDSSTGQRANEWIRGDFDGFPVIQDMFIAAGKGEAWTLNGCLVEYYVKEYRKYFPLCTLQDITENMFYRIPLQTDTNAVRLVSSEPNARPVAVSFLAFF